MMLTRNSPPRGAVPRRSAEREGTWTWPLAEDLLAEGANAISIVGMEMPKSSSKPATSSILLAILSVASRDLPA
jgi:hypothetical protein